VLGENPKHRALHGEWLVFIEPRGELLDGVAVGQKQRLPGALIGALGPDQLVHRSVADPAFDRFFSVQHHKSERQSFVVMSYNFVTLKRHRNAPELLRSMDFSDNFGKKMGRDRRKRALRPCGNTIRPGVVLCA
jgi:hypothetical protein